MKLPWAPRGHMLLFLIEEAFQLLHRVLSLVSGQSAIRNGVRQSSVVSGPVLLSSDNLQSLSAVPTCQGSGRPAQAGAIRNSKSEIGTGSPFLRFSVSPFRRFSGSRSFIPHSAFHIDGMLRFPVSPFLRFAQFHSAFRIPHSTLTKCSVSPFQ
jgi:hypothetical protein